MLTSPGNKISDLEHLMLCIKTVHICWAKMWLCFGFSPLHTAVLVYAACPPTLEMWKTQIRFRMNKLKHDFNEFWKGMHHLILINYYKFFNWSGTESIWIYIICIIFECIYYTWYKNILLLWLCTISITTSL